MSTRRSLQGYHFDHGAQYFTAREERFRSYVESWLSAGLVALWEGRICSLQQGEVAEKGSGIPRFVGVPGMNAVCKRLAADLQVKLHCEVGSVCHDGTCWRLLDVESAPMGTFDAVIASAPAPQAAALMEAVPDLANRVGQVDMSPCWAVMTVFRCTLPLTFEGAFVHGSALSWISRNSSKPQRPDAPETWVLHASADWSQEHLEDSHAEVIEALLDEFWGATGHPRVEAEHVAAHRWRYAQLREPLPESHLFDQELRIGACGDWCGGPSVEGALLSGLALASAVVHTVGSK